MAAVSTIDDELVPARGFPDLDNVERAAGDDFHPVRRPGDGIHNAGRRLVGQQVCTGLRPPDLDSAVRATGGDLFAIRRPADSVDLAVVAFITRDRLPTIGLPDLYAVVGAAGGDLFAIRRPGNGMNLVAMAAIDQHIIAAQRVPDLHSVVVTARGDTAAVGRPRQRIHPLCMASVRVNEPTACSLVYLHDIIASRRGNIPAVRRPRHRLHGQRVVVTEVLITAGGIPDLYRPVAATGGDARAVGRPAYGVDRTRMAVVNVDDVVHRLPAIAGDGRWPLYARRRLLSEIHEGNTPPHQANGDHTCRAQHNRAPRDSPLFLPTWRYRRKGWSRDGNGARRCCRRQRWQRRDGFCCRLDYRFASAACTGRHLDRILAFQGPVRRSQGLRAGRGRQQGLRGGIHRRQRGIGVNHRDGSGDWPHNGWLTCQAGLRKGVGKGFHAAKTLLRLF